MINFDIPSLGISRSVLFSDAFFTRDLSARDSSKRTTLKRLFDMIFLVLSRGLTREWHIFPG